MDTITIDECHHPTPAMTTTCPGCGLRLPGHPGPTHPCIGASAACWALHGEVLAREYGSLATPAGYRLTVDANAVQHPDRPERRAIWLVPATEGRGAFRGAN